jgi:hypothetical protein
MSEATTVEAVLKRDRAVVLAGVAGLSALAWAYLLALAGRTPHEDMAMAMPQMHAWGAAEVVLTWVMWAVMMVAMMTPSAAPMILTCATLNRRRRARAGDGDPLRRHRRESSHRAGSDLGELPQHAAGPGLPIDAQRPRRRGRLRAGRGLRHRPGGVHDDQRRTVRGDHALVHELLAGGAGERRLAGVRRRSLPDGMPRRGGARPEDRPPGSPHVSAAERAPQLKAGAAAPRRTRRDRPGV